MAETDTQTPCIEAQGLGLEWMLGSLYQGIDVRIDPGQAVAVCGAADEARSALLLTLAGRMKPTSGTLQIGGTSKIRLARAIDQVGLGPFSGVSDIPSEQRVFLIARTQMRERHLPHSQADIASYLHEWRLDATLRSYVGDLSPVELKTLGAALAFLGHPRAVVLEDVDRGITHQDAIDLQQRITDLAHRRGMAVVFGTAALDLAKHADSAIYLPTEGN